MHVDILGSVVSLSMRKSGRSLWPYVSLGLSFGALLIVIGLTANETTWQQFLEFPPAYLVAAFAVSVGLWLLEGIRITFVLRAMGERISLWEVVKINLATGLVAGLTPAQSGGPPLQTYLLTRAGVSLGKAAAVVALKSLITALFYGLTVPALLLFWGRWLGLSPTLTLLAKIAAVAIVLGIACLAYLILRPGIFKSGIDWFFNLSLVRRFTTEGTRYRISSQAYREIRKFSEGIALAFSGNGIVLLPILLLLTAVFWLTFFSVALVLLKGLEVHMPPQTVLAKQAVFYFLISYVPLPGGSGAAELGFASIFSKSVPGPSLPVFVTTWRFFTYHVNLIAGAISFSALSRGSRR